MFGPAHLQIPGSLWQVCKEKIVAACPECCGTGICTLCLEFAEYGEAVLGGEAEQNVSGQYVGSVAGGAFLAYWESTYDECEFVVEFDGNEVGRFPKCDESGSGMSCRNPSETIEDVTVGSTIGDLTFAPKEKKRLRRSPAIKDDPCKIQFALLFDTSFRNEYGTDDIIGNLGDLVTNLTGSGTDEYALALISFDPDAAVFHLDFTNSNGVAFLAEVAALTDRVDPNPGTVEFYRASGDALALAVNLNWDPNAQRKIVFLAMQGYPGLIGDSDLGNAQENSQQLNATALAALGCEIHFLNLPVPTSPSGHVDHSRSTVNATTIANGNGTDHGSANSDGDGAWNSGVNEIAPAINDSAAAIECAAGRCAKCFCTDAGECKECTCEKLCVTVTVTDDGEPQCVASGVIPWTDLYNECEIGTLTPEWGGALSCAGLAAETVTVEIFLIADEYEQCVAYGTVYGETFNIDLSEVAVDPLTMTATWTVVVGYKTIVVTTTCAGCSDSCSITVDCCANPLPRTLNADYLQTSMGAAAPMGDDCSCLDGTYPLTFIEASAEVGAPFAGWNSGKLAWPCANPLRSSWAIHHYCLASVWAARITFWDADDGVVLEISLSDFDVGECDPYEHDYSEASNSVGCVPGVISNNFTLSVSE